MATTNPQPIASASPTSHTPLPPHIAAAVWQGDQLGAPITRVVASGHAKLDAELPGGGWPCRALTEVLAPQPGVLEWRLIAPALSLVAREGRQVVVVGPPRQPHLPGLRQAGLEEQCLVWVDAQTPADRLWCTELLIRADGAAVVAWLPQIRPEDVRRLQVHAQGYAGLVFLCRPAAAQHEASAAPLRVLATLGAGLDLQVHVIKRRGPAHEGGLRVSAAPVGLSAVLPEQPTPARDQVPLCEVAADDVVGSDVVVRPRWLASVG